MATSSGRARKNASAAAGSYESVPGAYGASPSSSAREIAPPTAAAPITPSWSRAAVGVSAVPKSGALLQSSGGTREPACSAATASSAASDGSDRPSGSDNPSGSDRMSGISDSDVRPSETAAIPLATWSSTEAA